MKTTLILCIAFVHLNASAQEQDSTQEGRISIRSLPPGAGVFLDSVYAGRTPLDRLTLRSGDHNLLVFFPTPYDWNAFVQSKSFHLEPGGEWESTFEFGTVLSLHTVPSGASVFFQGSEIGRTPLFYRSNSALHGTFTVSHEGFTTETIAMQNLPRVIRLIPEEGRPLSSELFVEYPSDQTPRRWTSIGSAVGMVASGVAAAYFKDKANREFDRYSSTGNSAHLSATQRYDRFSLISLIVTQITFALLTYSLLMEN